MRIEETGIAGCKLIEIEPHIDERGFFARTWCATEFRQAGLSEELVQCSLSRNNVAGTTRGLHFQLPPSRESKLVTCSRGAVMDVVLDIRTYSDSFLKHISVELSEENCRALYVPFGCAHGFQTLADNSDVRYQMSDEYAPDLATGIRWDDPELDISWPGSVAAMNDRDRRYPDLDIDWLRSLDWTTPQ